MDRTLYVHTCSTVSKVPSAVGCYFWDGYAVQETAEINRNLPIGSTYLDYPTCS